LTGRGAPSLRAKNDKLFADLEALNEEQIEVGLAAGVWSEQVRPLVKHYLYDLKLKRVEAAAVELDETRKEARLAVEQAGKAKFWATAAFIIAGGAIDGRRLHRLSCSAEIWLRAALVMGSPGRGIEAALLGPAGCSAKSGD
jgi:hypothetical protein